MKRLAPLLLLASPMLAACDSSAGETPMPKVTQQEEDALEDAEAMLEEQRNPPETVATEGESE